MAKADEIILSSAQACRLWKISRKALAEWVKKGLPTRGRSKYPLFAGQEWINAFREADKPPQTLTDARTRLVDIQAQTRELELKQKQGDLIRVADVENDLTLLLTDFKLALLNWSRRLPQALEHKSAREIGDVLDYEARLLLNALRNGKTRITKKATPAAARATIPAPAAGLDGSFRHGYSREG